MQLIHFLTVIPHLTLSLVKHLMKLMFQLQTSMLNISG